jgi:hypothetical protein
MRTVPPATATATTTTNPIPRRIVEAGSVGSSVVEADALREVETGNELAELVEDDDAAVDGPVETVELVAVVVEDALVADVLEMVVVEVVEDDVEL